MEEFAAQLSREAARRFTLQLDEFLRRQQQREDLDPGDSLVFTFTCRCELPEETRGTVPLVSAEMRNWTTADHIVADLEAAGTLSFDTLERAAAALEGILPDVAQALQKVELTPKLRGGEGPAAEATTEKP